jgi:ribosomal protein L11 methyltransferase
MLQELRFEVAEDVADALSDALLQAGALSVGIEDAAADTPAERPLYGEPGLAPERPAWARNRLVVLIDADSDPQRLLAAAAAGLVEPPPRVESIVAVGDVDWVRLNQSQFGPTRVGERLWIVPSWHAAPDPGAVVVRLDPGVAFGTGTHPTTRLMLQWLDEHPPRGFYVLDYGCGSGILAIAAAKLGAARVAATDIDPLALAAARANAAANAVGGDYTAPEAVAPGPFDLVLANILTNPLKLLAPLLLGRVGAGGTLLLSGVLERQADEVIDAYAAVDPGVPLSAWRRLDGWVCLAGSRR